MRLSEFEFPFDPAMVALRPVKPRDRARLLLVPRHEGPYAHYHVADLPFLLQPGDLLVLNDTRVVPARLEGRKLPGGGKVDLLFVRELEEGIWEALLNGGGKPGQRIQIDDAMSVSILSNGTLSRIRVEGTCQLRELLQHRGQMPLPPYIKRAPTAEDRSWYQTIFARRAGSIAAPTAGLHFTEGLLNRLVAGGVRIAWITLHVGPGTFLPVRSEQIERHTLVPETFDVPADTAEAISRTRAKGQRVVAVGTTVVRALETAVAAGGTVTSGKAETNLFVTPGYRFHVVNGLLTNFHLPRSTLLMLVAAFAGLERVRAAYEEAIRQRYRLYSYGDAMLIL